MGGMTSSTRPHADTRRAQYENGRLSLRELHTRIASPEAPAFCRQSDGSRDDPDPARLEVSVTTRDPEESPLADTTLEVRVHDADEGVGPPGPGQQLVIPDVPGQVAAMAAVNDPVEIRAVANKAKALADLYRRERGKASQQYRRAVCFELTAARRLGAVLEASAPHGGDRRSRSMSSTLKLEDLGVSKTQSSIYRAISRPSDAAWIEYLDMMVDRGTPISFTAASSWARAVVDPWPDHGPVDQADLQRRQNADGDDVETSGAAACESDPQDPAQAPEAPHHDSAPIPSPRRAKEASKRRTAFEKFPFPRGPKQREVALKRVSEFLGVFVHCSSSPEWHEQVRTLLHEVERKIPVPSTASSNGTSVPTDSEVKA